MKALLSTFLVIATFSAAPVLAGAVAEAQAEPPHGQAGIVRALDLTPQERQQAQPILRSSSQQLRALEDQTRTTVFEALSPDHRQQVQQIVAQARQELQAARQSQGSARQVKPILDKDARQIDAILTPQESQAVLAQRANAESQARNIISSTVRQLRPILTSDQQQKLDAWSSKMQQREGREGQPDAGRFLLMVAMHGERARGMHHGSRRAPATPASS